MKWPRRVKEDRDDQDGKSSPTAPAANTVPAELAAEHVVVPQDRQQRAQGRGRQRQPDRHVVPDVAGLGQPGRDAQSDDRADSRSRPSPACPAVAGAARDPARNQPAGTRSRAPRWPAAGWPSVQPGLSTCGPMRTPPSMKMTTCGMRGPGSRATTSGASTATTPTATRSVSPWLRFMGLSAQRDRVHPGTSRR